MSQKETLSIVAGEKPAAAPKIDHLRFHRRHAHLSTPFGEGWFARKAEGFARFFGTPMFLGAQTLIVIGWVCVNTFGWAKFDIYPFILLNLAFSLQSAYAAPLILLAQTRQAERDKAHADADALHREALAVANAGRQELAAQTAAQMMALLQQNTELTTLTKNMSERIEVLAAELHKKLLQDAPKPQP
ncbi:DUF1003 domain-containing protein [Acerihabitans arboris]|uniref:DUF1003 domain-containing protein n=1 Tax=Acerihabitans arboris TaxID=2691583 RepID=A0A845SMC8_9GAMM|nr:DUF1003 domain-containing protein [Acerihabitans arboris]NDL64104.1 DUF1003 domain-containing protein [Acerihabitans arboris]